MACCDAFDAMVTDRPYRSALPLDDALQEIRDGAGTQFDPQSRCRAGLSRPARDPEPQTCAQPGVVGHPARADVTDYPCAAVRWLIEGITEGSDRY